MPDERQAQDGETKRVATEDKIQTEGREENDARPLNAADNNGGAERYPSVRQDDAVESGGEGRSFDPRADAPTPRQGAGDGPAKQEGFAGGQGDPVEGKR